MTTVKFGGNSYTVEYPYEAFCAMQDALGIDDIAEVFAKFKGSNFKMIATMLWAGLLKADDTLTIKDVYKILELATEGEIYNATLAMYEEFAKSFAQKVAPKETNEKAKNANSPVSH